MENLLFLLVALLAVVSGALAIWSRNPRTASQSRAAFLLSLAPLYTQLGAPYLGLLQFFWALAVAWRSWSATAWSTRKESSWLSTVSLLSVGLLSAALWWSTYQDFPRRPARGEVASLWGRPADLLEPAALVSVLLVLVLAVAWALHEPGEEPGP